MKFRETAIFTGHVFQVPERIQRIDTDNTHGWQLRYGDEPTEFFADGTSDGSGAGGALDEATTELHKRIRRLPAPNGLKTEVATWKRSGLPLGISQQAKPRKKGGVLCYYFQVSVPVVGGASTTKKVYIGTANTISEERITEKLAEALAMREKSVTLFETAKTREKRAAARLAQTAR